MLKTVLHIGFWVWFGYFKGNDSIRKSPSICQVVNETAAQTQISTNPCSVFAGKTAATVFNRKYGKQELDSLQQLFLGHSKPLRLDILLSQHSLSTLVKRKRSSRKERAKGTEGDRRDTSVWVRPAEDTNSWAQMGCIHEC